MHTYTFILFFSCHFDPFLCTFTLSSDNNIARLPAPKLITCLIALSRFYALYVSHMLNIITRAYTSNLGFSTGTLASRLRFWGSRGSQFANPRTNTSIARSTIGLPGTRIYAENVWWGELKTWLVEWHDTMLVLFFFSMLNTLVPADATRFLDLSCQKRSLFLSDLLREVTLRRSITVLEDRSQWRKFVDRVEGRGG